VASLLVMTGVTGPHELVSAAPEERPTYLAADLGGLLQAHPIPEDADDGSSLGGWRAFLVEGVLEVQGAGTVDDWWRVVADAAWRFLDDTGEVADVTRLAPPQPETVSRS
jgi:hypothetical protein